jgi:hypothetical protein
MTIVIIAIFGYLLASAFFLGCVMLTARGKENGNRVTVPFKHSDARGGFPKVMLSPEEAQTYQPSLRPEPKAFKKAGEFRP